MQPYPRRYVYPKIVLRRLDLPALTGPITAISSPFLILMSKFESTSSYEYFGSLFSTFPEDE